MSTQRTSPRRMARKISRLLRSELPDAIYLKKIFQYVRQDLALTGQSRAPRKLPDLLTDAELMRFYEVLLEGANPVHVILVKMLLFCGIRNAELVQLQLQDVDLVRLQVRVRRGKGCADREVPIPEGFRGELLQYLDRQKSRGAAYFLESRLRKPYTTRRIRQILKTYADQASIEKRLYPHLFRHQLLTFLTREGLLDAQLQRVSGHRSRESLALYQTLSLADVQPKYQDAMSRFPVR